MNPVRVIRTVAGWTQSRLAQTAGTSQPTIAAYESGAKSPTWRTVVRLAESAELACYPSVGRPLTRDQARSLALHQAIIDAMMAEPAEVLEAARVNLVRMRRSNPGAGELLDEWDRILRQPLRQIAAMAMDPGERGRDLRQVTPFAGVIDPRRRADVYRSFRC
jgi:DNA-binding XRE family transcriptional regulator